MGAGKSYIAIQNVRHVATTGTKRTLILCPSAVLGVWRREFWIHAREQFDVIVLDGKHNSVKKAEIVSDALKVQQSHGRPVVIVVNYETFWRKEIFKVLSSVIWEKIICDESHRIKAHGAKCSQHAWKLGMKCGSRSGLTGTPMPNNPGDIFAQYRFLQESIFGRYWTHFRNRYAVMNKMIPQKVDKWINLDELHQKIDTIKYYIGKEVLVLPEKQNITIEVNLSPAGRKLYNEMRKESMIEIQQQIDIGKENGEDMEQIKTAVASNGAVRFLRLLQLAQGYITDDDGEDINTDTEKRRTLMDLLDDAGEPVCVYGWFKHDLRCVERCCEILGLRYGEISGRRKDLTPHATMPENIDVMGVQCKSGSSGIDLTRSRIAIIMNSGLLSPGDYDQMEARQYRPGQTRDVVYYSLVTKGTVETKLINDRGEKRSIVDALMAELVDESELVF